MASARTGFPYVNSLFGVKLYKFPFWKHYQIPVVAFGLVFYGAYSIQESFRTSDTALARADLPNRAYYERKRKEHDLEVFGKETWVRPTSSPDAHH